MRSQYRFSALFLCTALAMLAGCDGFNQLQDGMEQSVKLAADLKAATGAEAAVGFNGMNGQLTSVNVTFATNPEKLTLPELAKLTREAVLKRFKSEPKNITLSFVIE